MTTELKKKVSRVTLGTHRGRKLVVSFVPGDCVEIREKGRRTVETVSIAWLYDLYDQAIISRVAREKFLKKQARKNKLTR